MENTNANQQNQENASSSNIIFGTSSDAIEEGLHSGQFIERDVETNGVIDDKNKIVNEQEQNEIVNPAEESFDQGTSPETTINESSLTSDKKDLPKEEKPS